MGLRRERVLQLLADFQRHGFALTYLFLPNTSLNVFKNYTLPFHFKNPLGFARHVFESTLLQMQIYEAVATQNCVTPRQLSLQRILPLLCVLNTPQIGLFVPVLNINIARLWAFS